jgi:hypothetical protein
MRSWVHTARGPFARLAWTRFEDLNEEHLSIEGDDHPAGRRPGNLRHPPQGILHGADEAARAAFQARRTPGARRTGISIGVDTYRPLRVAPEFARMAG